jgi:DNA repair protein RadC
MSHRIQDLPMDDRPRERLLRLGPGALTDAELLALFINTGVRGENAIQVAQRLLREAGSLRQLARVAAPELAQARALGPAKAAHLVAAFELGRRAEREWVKETPLNSPELVYRHVAAEMQALAHETVRVLLLNTRLHLMREERVFTGTVNETVAHPREILQPVIVHKAYGFTVVHNHPSGDPSPSEADRRLTRRLREAAEVLGLVFLDHLIIGLPAEGRGQPYFSFKECGLL